MWRLVKQQTPVPARVPSRTNLPGFAGPLSQLSLELPVYRPYLSFCRDSLSTVSAVFTASFASISPRFAVLQNCATKTTRSIAVLCSYCATSRHLGMFHCSTVVKTKAAKSVCGHPSKAAACVSHRFKFSTSASARQIAEVCPSKNDFLTNQRWYRYFALLKGFETLKTGLVQGQPVGSSLARLVCDPCLTWRISLSQGPMDFYDAQLDSALLSMLLYRMPVFSIN